MFSNVKTKKRITQLLIAFVVICMSVTGSFMLLEDTIESASAATKNVTVSDSASWNSAFTGVNAGDNVTITLGSDLALSSKLTPIPAGVNVELKMNGKSIYWDTFDENSIAIMTQALTPKTDYWGLITNSGTLNITGTGTIRMMKVNYNRENDNEEYNEFTSKAAAIVNLGEAANLTIGSGITVENYLAMCFNAQGGTNSYADMFLYGCAVYNEGTVTSSGNIIAETMATGIGQSQHNSYNYAFSYGIYGGTVKTAGGSITSNARSGGMAGKSDSKKGNHMVAIGVGVYSGNAQILGNTAINTQTITWMSKGNSNIWGDGYDISISVGVMYPTTNYPVIGASVDINSTFQCPGGDKITVYVPPASKDKYYSELYNNSAPGEYARRAYPVAGVQKNQYTIGNHGNNEKTWNSDGGFFGTCDSSGSGDINKVFNFDSNTFYYTEEAYFGGNRKAEYLENASEQAKHETGNNSAETKTGVIRNGVIGEAGTQYKVMYRYYNNSISAANLQSVSPAPENDKINGAAVISIGGNTTHTVGSWYKGTQQSTKQVNNNGAIKDATAAMAYASGATSVNGRYYKLESMTCEKVSTDDYPRRDYYDKDSWSAGGGTFSGSVTMTTNNTLVIYMNYVLQAPSAVRVAVGNEELNSESVGNTFTVSYTGTQLIPGEDFKIAIIDMGSHASPDTNDTFDDTLVTSAYDISGKGNSSGNNATAVRYKHSTDNVNWKNDLPKDAGTYTVEIEVYEDRTFAPESEGTYNRLSATARVTCVIRKAEITITGPDSVNGIYGSRYKDLIPETSYTVTGKGDTLEGSWSYAGVNADAYPNAGSQTVNLVWTPRANTTTANNYNVTTKPVSLSVDKREVVVNAGVSEVVYGNSNPAFAFDFAGTLAPCDQDNVAGWISNSTFLVDGAAYQPGIVVGDSYKVTIESFGGLSDPNNNFTINQANGTLKVTPRDITYKATAVDRKYFNGPDNDKVDVILNYVSGNYQNDDYDKVINTKGTILLGANAGDNKQVVVTEPLIKNSENYKLVISNKDSVTVNIAKATPTGVRVKAEPESIVYDSTKTLQDAVRLAPVETSIPGTWVWDNVDIIPSADVPTYLAKFMPTDAVNYEEITQKVPLTVQQKEVIVSVKNYSLVYGESVPAFKGDITYTGFTGTDTVGTIAGVSGSAEASSTYKKGSAVGTYPVVVESDLTSTNYFFTKQDSSIVVSPKTLKVSVAPQSVEYGATFPELGVNDITFDGFLANESYTVLKGTPSFKTNYVPGSTVGTYKIEVTGYSADNYSIQNVDGTLEVTQATLKVTPNNVEGVTYGAAVPAYAANKLYTYSGFIPGESAENVVINGTPAFTTGYEPGMGVGTYPVSVSVSALSSVNYKFVGVEGSLVIGKATPVVAEVPGAQVVNSHKFKEATFDGGSIVNPNSNLAVSGTFAFKSGETVAEWGADDFQDVVFTPADTNNYNSITIVGEVWLEIVAKAVTGTPVIQGSAMAGSTLAVSLASMDPSDAQYYTFEWYADGLKIAGATGTTLQLDDSSVGSQYQVKVIPNNDKGFTGGAKMSDMTSVVIEALKAVTSEIFNEVDIMLEYDSFRHGTEISVKDEYKSGIFGEMSVKYNGVAEKPRNAGRYIVTVDVLAPEKPAEGYSDDTYGPATGIVVGEITITPATLTVRLDATDKYYDGTTAANANFTISGRKDEMDNVEVAPGAKFAFGDVNVGTNKEVVVESMQLTGDDAGNYIIEATASTANIIRRPIYYKVVGTPQTYDGTTAIKNVTFVYDTAKNKESSDWGYAAIDSASTIYPINGVGVAAGANAGTQLIIAASSTPAGSSAANYEIRYSDLNKATVVIDKAKPEVAAPEINGITYNCDTTLAGIDLSPYDTTFGVWDFVDKTIVPTVNQKTYSAKYVPSDRRNYVDITMDIIINVEPRHVVLTPKDVTVMYGSKAPVFEILHTDMGSDTLADIGGSCTVSCTYTPGAPVSDVPYTIRLINAYSDDNYVFTTETGSLTVVPAKLVYTATAESKVYNGSSDINVKFNYTSGRYGSDDVSLNISSTIGQAATANAGTTTVDYSMPYLVGSKSANYELYVTPAPRELKVTIEKADVTGVIFPADATVQFGYDLRYATFDQNGEGDGTFAFANAKDIVPPTTGFFEYTVVFTPTDSRNYNTQETTLIVEVTKCILDYIVGVAGTAQDGETLSVVFTGLPSRAVEFVNYQWYRVNEYEAIAIPDATESKYVATSADVGYTLAVVTYFDESDPFEYKEGSYESAFDDVDKKCIIGASEGTVKEISLTFWQRIINWINRIIAALTGLTLNGGLGL